jgi:hypothetical protein
MIIYIPGKDGDDDKFLTAVSSLIATLVAERCPNDLYVTRINKWFDHKWLGYSGVGRAEFKGYAPIDTFLDPIWQDKLTFPPFNPNQISQQKYWRRRDDGTYGGVGDPKWIHKWKLQSSANNLNNRVVEFSDSGLFVWFTSNTEPNKYGSVMIYQVDGKDVSGWYASFRQENDWIVDKTKGIDKKTVESWFPIS